MQLGRVAARSPPAEFYLGLQIAGLFEGGQLGDGTSELKAPVALRGLRAVLPLSCGRHAPDAGCFFP